VVVESNLLFCSDSLVVEGCVFKANGALQNGGAILALSAGGVCFVIGTYLYVFGRVLTKFASQPVTISKSNFTDNFANNENNEDVSEPEKHTSCVF
jgi:predicted outer membrane repeat protein